MALSSDDEGITKTKRLTGDRNVAITVVGNTGNIGSIIMNVGAPPTPAAPAAAPCDIETGPKITKTTENKREDLKRKAATCLRAKSPSNGIPPCPAPEAALVPQLVPRHDLGWTARQECVSSRGGGNRPTSQLSVNAAWPRAVSPRSAVSGAGGSARRQRLRQPGQPHFWQQSETIGFHRQQA